MAENSANSAARRRWPAWAVPPVAAVAAVVVWLTGAAFGVDVEASTGASAQPVTVVAVAVTALVVGLAGWGVRAVIGRITKGGGGGGVVWLVLCGVVLLGSLLGAASGTTPGAVVVLLTEHMVVGAVIALGLRGAGRGVTPGSTLA